MTHFQLPLRTLFRTPFVTTVAVLSLAPVSVLVRPGIGVAIAFCTGAGPGV